MTGNSSLTNLASEKLKTGTTLPRSSLGRFQVGWFTSDGASVNRTTLREFKKDLTDADADWSADDHDVL
jgi:hypothetical protein